MQLDDLRQIATEANTALRMPNINSNEGKSRIRRILDTAVKSLKRLSCARDDIVTSWDMPEAPSSRPSEVGMSQRHTIVPRRRPSEARTSTAGTTTTTTFPRHDSTLLHDAMQVI